MNLNDYFKKANTQKKKDIPPAKGQKTKEIFLDSFIQSPTKTEMNIEGIETSSPNQNMTTTVRSSLGRNSNSLQSALAKTNQNSHKNEKKVSNHHPNMMKEILKIDAYTFFKENQTELEKAKLSIDVSQTYNLFTDGACKGNPGTGGAGYAIFDLNGKEMYTNSVYLGESTNNIAEYAAIVYGIKSAIHLGIKRLEVYSDSELAIRQIKGENRVMDQVLLIYHKEALNLIAKLENVTINWIPRDSNKYADKLAKMGIEKEPSKSENPKKNQSEEKTKRKSAKKEKADSKGGPIAIIEPKKLNMEEEEEEIQSKQPVIVMEEELGISNDTSLPMNEKQEVGTEHQNQLTQEGNKPLLEVTFDNKSPLNVISCIEERQSETSPNQLKEELSHDQTCNKMEFGIRQTLSPSGVEINHNQIANMMHFSSNSWLIDQERSLANLKFYSDRIAEKVFDLNTNTDNMINYGINCLEPWKKETTQIVNNIIHQTLQLENWHNTTVRGCSELEKIVLKLSYDIHKISEDNLKMQNEIQELKNQWSVVEHGENKKELENRKNDFVRLNDEHLETRKVVEEEFKRIEEKFDKGMNDIKEYLRKLETQERNEIKSLERVSVKDDVIQENKSEERTSLSKGELADSINQRTENGIHEENEGWRIVEKKKTSKRIHCWFDQNCYRGTCVFYHTVKKCHFGSKCDDKNCQFRHCTDDSHKSSRQNSRQHNPNEESFHSHNYWPRYRTIKMYKRIGQQNKQI